jgi:hypothetical protein
VNSDLNNNANTQDLGSLDKFLLEWMCHETYSFSAH